MRFHPNAAMIRARTDLGFEWFDGLAAEAVLRETVDMDIREFSATPGRCINDICEAFYSALWRVDNAYPKKEEHAA